jgi:hypothetical protein
VSAEISIATSFSHSIAAREAGVPMDSALAGMRCAFTGLWPLTSVLKLIPACLLVAADKLSHGFGGGSDASNDQLDW